MSKDRTKGLIIRGVGGLYTVVTDGGEEILCRARGVLRREQITPTVGDDVYFSSATEEEIRQSVAAEQDAVSDNMYGGRCGTAQLQRQRREKEGKKSRISVKSGKAL